MALFGNWRLYLFFVLNYLIFSLENCSIYFLQSIWHKPGKIWSAVDLVRHSIFSQFNWTGLFYIIFIHSSCCFISSLNYNLPSLGCIIVLLTSMIVCNKSILYWSCRSVQPTVYDLFKLHFFSTFFIQLWIYILCNNICKHTVLCDIF